MIEVNKMQRDNKDFTQHKEMFENYLGALFPAVGIVCRGSAISVISGTPDLIAAVYLILNAATSSYSLCIFTC